MTNPSQNPAPEESFVTTEPTWSGRIREAMPVVGLTAGCLLIFLVALWLTFPEGTSLRGLVQSDENNASATGQDGQRELDTGRTRVIAQLQDMNNRVKDKSSKGILWRDSELGMDLENRHSVQTFDDATARIAFDGDNSLTLGENSLVVLKSFDRKSDGSEKRANLLVLEGQLSGDLVASGPDSLQIEFETEAGIARIANGGDGESTRFQVRVNEDKSSSIAVSGGRAEILTKEGVVRVEGSQLIRISRDGSTTFEELPDAPRVTGPSDGRIWKYGGLPPRVAFDWEPVSGSDEYRLVVARDARFDDVALDTRTNETAFTHGNLQEGEYYWRVSSTKDGLEGLSSRPHKLLLDRDLAPPALSLKWPQTDTVASGFLLEGKAEPNSRVFVANAAVPVDSRGRFSHALELKPGANVLVVEAVDAAGNSSYESRTLFNDPAGGKQR